MLFGFTFDLRSVVEMQKARWLNGSMGVSYDTVRNAKFADLKC